MPKPMLSIGNNQKLCKKVAIFNMLHLKTCPGHTALCKEICYAEGPEKRYPAALAQRTRNTSKIDRPSFVKDMIAEIGSVKALQYQRNFESGDFNSQSAVDKLFEVARAFPNILFLSYTKSFMFDFSKKPDNYSLIFSVDKTTTLTVPQYPWTRTAYLVAEGETIPAGYNHTCNQVGKSGKMDHHYCATTCFKCWHGAIKRIYFLEH